MIRLGPKPPRLRCPVLGCSAPPEAGTFLVLTNVGSFSLGRNNHNYIHILVQRSPRQVMFLLLAISRPPSVVRFAKVICNTSVILNLADGIR